MELPWLPDGNGGFGLIGGILAIVILLVLSVVQNAMPALRFIGIGIGIIAGLILLYIVCGFFCINIRLYIRNLKYKRIRCKRHAKGLAA